jgi:hypothetical protein
VQGVSPFENTNNRHNIQKYKQALMGRENLSSRNTYNVLIVLSEVLFRTFGYTKFCGCTFPHQDSKCPHTEQKSNNTSTVD